MTRFKRLSKEDLVILEKQFVKFLAAQSILADDWTKIKANDPNRTREIIDQFSDMVYGSVMQSAQFLERITHDTLYCYQCLDDRFVLIAFKVDSGSDFDLRNTSADQISEIVSSSKAKVYTSEKIYSDQKEDEVFKMLELGSEITDGSMFKILALIL